MMTTLPPRTGATVERRPPLAFIYDRNASRSTLLLNARLLGCQSHAEHHGWDIAGEWLDLGAHALDNTRPQFSELVAAMQSEATRRTVICLVHNWNRLTNDPEDRINLQQRVAQAGGHTETTFEESDARARNALTSESRRHGR
jgi:hypothetical protein